MKSIITIVAALAGVVVYEHVKKTSIVDEVKKGSELWNKFLEKFQNPQK